MPSSALLVDQSPPRIDHLPLCLSVCVATAVSASHHSYLFRSVSTSVACV